MSKRPPVRILVWSAIAAALTVVGLDKVKASGGVPQIRR